MTTLLDALDAAVNHHMTGERAAAERLYRLALAVDPASAAAWHLWGVLAAQGGGNGARARTALQRSLRINPVAEAPWAHLGGVLLTAGDGGGAVAALRRALALDPAGPDALTNLGIALHAAHRLDRATLWLWRAHTRRPDHDDTLLNLGMVLRDRQAFADAGACFNAVIARHPDHAGAHLALAVSHLVQGDFPAGWGEFEWRWKRLSTPPWRGEPLDGATILLHAEQGFGDTLQFARYAPLVAARGGRVVLEVHPRLVRLLRRLDPAVTVVARSDPPPAHQHHCPLMSLPRAFATTLDTIPAAAPLTPDPGDAARWRERLAAGPDGLRVGVVWAGNPGHRNDRNRSLPLPALDPLLDVPDLRLFRLQAGPAPAATPPRWAARLEDPMGMVADFADTAALLAALDLLITVDTAMVHLAGSLGRPAWLLLPYAPDWRWLLGRNDSPWYPGVRLFRQPQPGDWARVGHAVARAARRLARP